MRRGRKRIGRIAGSDLSRDDGDKILAYVLLQQPKCNGGRFILDAGEPVESFYLFRSIRRRAAYVIGRSGVVVILQLVDGHEVELQSGCEIVVDSLQSCIIAASAAAAEIAAAHDHVFQILL